MSLRFSPLLSDHLLLANSPKLPYGPLELGWTINTLHRVSCRKQASFERDGEICTEDSERVEGMATALQIFKKKKQAGPVWPQKLDVRAIRFGSTYSGTLNRQCCLLVV